jgi:hypothetical protein
MHRAWVPTLPLLGCGKNPKYQQSLDGRHVGLGVCRYSFLAGWHPQAEPTLVSLCKVDYLYMNFEGPCAITQALKASEGTACTSGALPREAHDYSSKVHLR